MAIQDEENTNPNRVKNVNDSQHQRNAPGNKPDPSAKRNVGLGGDLERNDQKDRLENLHIGGNEVTGMGHLDRNSTESHNQGPGFEAEGSDTFMGGENNGIRMKDQPLDEGQDQASNNPEPGKI
ncbi:hypothetical protein TH61_16830 [Rufibacter sp. DG15C]|uniref:hypothetical protein n=1 Tax=Rufibacter sp. DG15C TaxID=1379909 RepID=UPI00078BD22B|nr:hypothetical protein [Rufibacter sp. DG15C]AMM52511.1 hypothetical protein TH61_16830 [Rufibacter sp. DG15C]